MYQIKLNILIVKILLVIATKSMAQSPTDGQMLKPRQMCFMLDYGHGKFSKYWEGTNIRENQTIATVKRNSATGMIALGIFKPLNLFIALPYIKTESSEPNGGKLAGVSGFQDFSGAIKYRWLNKQVRSSTITSFLTIGFSTPITNYLSDYLPYSLGLGAPELTYRAILQLETERAAYFQVSGAYLWRGYTRADRVYYYNNGSYYTAWMDVPSGIQSNWVIGKWFFESRIQVELSYQISTSLSGDDIRSYNAPQPTNRVDIDRVGGIIRYLSKQIVGLGFTFYHHRIIDGRNAHMMNTNGIALSYFFNYRK